MSKTEVKILCQTPTPNKKPTRIVKRKYDIIRQAILKVIPNEEPGLEFSLLAGMVRKTLDERTISKIGSIPWYTTTVKLEMEVRTELKRLPKTIPQKLIRNK